LVVLAFSAHPGFVPSTWSYVSPHDQLFSGVSPKRGIETSCRSRWKQRHETLEGSCTQVHSLGFHTGARGKLGLVEVAGTMEDVIIRQAGRHHRCKQTAFGFAASTIGKKRMRESRMR